MPGDCPFNLKVRTMSHPFEGAMRLNNLHRQSAIQPGPLADPEDPHRVQRSHLNKDEIGKSSGSCKLSAIIRLHRTLSPQEFWCASYEEADVYKNIAANVDVMAMKEQFTRLDYTDRQGCPRFTKTDAHVLMRDGDEVLVSVKYDEKSRRPSYLAEIADIASQSLAPVADRFIVASRFHFHPTYRANAQKIHAERLKWDPEADRIVLEAANDFQGPFKIAELVEKSRLSFRGYRATVRLLGDGDITKDLLDPINDNTVCKGVAA